jgi:hypothetical protein
MEKITKEQYFNKIDTLEEKYKIINKYIKDAYNTRKEHINKTYKQDKKNNEEEYKNLIKEQEQQYFKDKYEILYKYTYD